MRFASRSSKATRAPAAQSYANWQSIAHRKVNLDRRIDQGVRTRQLSQREAGRLKAELNSLVRLERTYLRGGLSRVERNDLRAKRFPERGNVVTRLSRARACIDNRNTPFIKRWRGVFRTKLL